MPLAEALKQFWRSLLNMFGSTADSQCSPEEPMYCPTKTLDSFFERQNLPMQTLVNSGVRRIDVQACTVYNDQYWKGFYASDSLLPSWVFQNGFNKRFTSDGGTVKGVTSTFDDSIQGQNKLSLIDPNDPSKGILLEYVEPQFALFYDILKIISQDVVIGKAFTGKYPVGARLLSFSMARKYGFDFMSAQDHKELFEKYGKVPDPSKVKGDWEGRMVSNASLTPPLFKFRYDVDSTGRVSCKWNFMNILKGDSKIEFTQQQMLMFDFTNFHDEIRMITDDVMVGKYAPVGQQVLNIIGDRSLGLLHFEKTAEGTRPCIYYYIRRVSGI